VLARNLLVLFMPWALIILGLTALLRDHLRDARLEPLLNAQRSALAEGEIALSRRLAIVRGNLTFLSQQPLLKDYLLQGGEHPEPLRELLHEFAASTDYYHHIRLFDLSGVERLAVDRRGESSPPLELSPAEIRSIQALSWGSVMLSGFRLGPSGEQELLLLMPIFDDYGNRRGALAFSYRTELIAQRLQEVSANYGVPLGLTSRTGDWIFPFSTDAVPPGAVASPPRTTASELSFEDQYGFYSLSAFDPALVLRVEDEANQDTEQWILVSLLPSASISILNRDVWLLIGPLAFAMLLAGLVVVVLLSRAEAARDRAMHVLAVRSDELAQRNLELNDAMEVLHRTQSALVQAEKLSSLGILVAGVAHELNTPIGAASVAASALKSDAEKAVGVLETIQDRDVQRFIKRSGPGLRIVQTNLERLAQFTRAFKKLASDRASTERRGFDLAELLKEVVLVLGPRLKGTPHEVIQDVPPRFMLDSYPGPISQILQNLIENALIHAFAPGVNGQVKVAAWRQEGGLVCIEVTDNGCGMDEQQKALIFDPFYTTKRGRGGTGLGLHITHQLTVNVLGGRIEVHSVPGEGTRFRLELHV
jgi:signal transduction histidine kinase